MLTHRFDGTPLTVTVDVAEQFAPLPAAVEVAAYRIAAEALTNITRHADATTANVQLRTAAGELRLIIRDNGVSPAPWRPGVGLSSMRDRAAELGGTCTAGPEATGGRVTVTLPLAAR
jgi:signal transduction histidine kinase